MSRREQLLSVRGLGGAVYLCSLLPHQECLAVVLCGSASSFTPPDHPRCGQCSRAGRSCPAVPWQAGDTEWDWETQAGATLFFFFLGMETLSNYCEERTACPLLHVPCPLPVIWIVFGRTFLVGVGVGGGTDFSHLQTLRNFRKKTQNVH